MKLMPRSRPALLAVLGALGVGACNDPTTAPALRSSEVRSAAVAPASACDTEPDFLVTDEASLQEATHAARRGDVIGIRGQIAIARGAVLEHAGVTVTCAEEGAGITLQPGSAPVWLLNVHASEVTIQGLALDGRGTVRGPVIAFSNGVNWIASDVRFVRNNVICGPGECVFFVGTLRATVSDNEFTSYGSATGIHIQGGSLRLPIDGTRVERNTVTALAPSQALFFGGIRPRDGEGLVVSENVVRGPWANSLSTVSFHDGAIVGNLLEGASAFGAAFNLVGTDMSGGTTIRNNRIRNTGGPSVFVRLTCSSVFAGNSTHASGGAAAWVFDRTSGDNVLLGNGKSVIDNGDTDCDGDGVSDPNQLAGQIRTGVRIGEAMNDAEDRSDPLILR